MTYPCFIVESKPKLPRGRSYVLNTSVLDAAFAESGARSPVFLNYWSPNPEGSILWVRYWLPNSNVPHRRFYVRAGSVPSSKRTHAFAQMQSIALPALRRWAACLDSLPDSSALLLAEPYFDAVYADGRLIVAQSPPAD